VTTEAGYDRIAEGYARHWGPVIRPAAEHVLDLVAPEIEAALATGATPHVVDVGTGTGTLAIRALERWPGLRVTGVDPSGGMLEIARRHATERLPASVAGRFEVAVGPADRLPLEAATVDLAVSSFVLQLVPSRVAALREVRRVLRPGATCAWVAWQRSDAPYAPDRIANEVLDDFGFDPPEPGGPSGDIATPEAAAAGMRKAGFRSVQAHTHEMAHEWDAAGYLAFYTQFDEESLFADLARGERRDIERRIRTRLQRLSPDELTLRLPVIYAMGRRPD
jgi:SAM-dependent methyltransferase